MGRMKQDAQVATLDIAAFGQAALKALICASDRLVEESTPISGILAFCARVASGKATAAPLTTPKNCRRRMFVPKLCDAASYQPKGVL
jgi:hypothetical protein